MVGIGAVVLFSARVEEVVAFYEAVGFPLEPEEHDDGVIHWACDAGSLHLAVYATDADGQSPGYHEAGSTFCGFTVDDVFGVTERLRALGCSVVVEPNEMPWGIRSVVLDPDGRPVEVVRSAL